MGLGGYLAGRGLLRRRRGLTMHGDGDFDQFVFTS